MAYHSSYKLAYLLLAAGQSTRMNNGNKLLMEINGKPIIHYAINAIQQSIFDTGFAVLGHQSHKVQAEIDGALPTVITPNFIEGMGATLAFGLQKLPEECDGALIILADMPAITAKHLNALYGAYRANHFIIPTYDGTRGNPIIVPKVFFEMLINRDAQDKGARELIAKNPDKIIQVAMKDDAILRDIDDAQDYKDFGS